MVKATRTAKPAWGALASWLSCASVSAASGLVLEDDFNDNMIGALWGVVETNPAQMTVMEQNMRLEFAAAANSGLAEGAALFGNGWGLDPAQDFGLTVSVHADLPTLPAGDAAVELSLGYDIDYPNENLLDGISVYVGSDDGGPYLGYEVEMNGSVVEEGFTPRTATDLDIFIWSVVAQDAVFLSTVAFFDPGATMIANVQARLGSDPPVVILGGLTEGTAIPGGDLYMDDFQVVDGAIVPVGVPGPPDVNGDGTVDVLDLLEVLTNWGPCPVGPCPADVNGDLAVDVLDLLEVLTNWG